jgi:hypothetical protein
MFQTLFQDAMIIDSSNEEQPAIKKKQIKRKKEESQTVLNFPTVTISSN